MNICRESIRACSPNLKSIYPFNVHRQTPNVAMVRTMCTQITLKYHCKLTLSPEQQPMDALECVSYVYFWGKHCYNKMQLSLLMMTYFTMPHFSNHFHIYISTQIHCYDPPCKDLSKRKFLNQQMGCIQKSLHNTPVHQLVSIFELLDLADVLAYCGECPDTWYIWFVDCETFLCLVHWTAERSLSGSNEAHTTK